MRITLLNYTKDAEDILIMSKETRHLAISDFEAVKKLSAEEKKKKLNYVFGSVGSSWEFVDYTFLIEGVTRAFTHQLVRHRVGTSFAQQTLRVVDASAFDYLSEDTCKNNKLYHETMAIIRHNYDQLVHEQGANIQDARGILPTNIKTSIMFKANLRSLADIISARLCLRVQGEFQAAAKYMKNLVLQVHPFTEQLFKPDCIKNNYCRWSNFEDCPVKKRFPHIKGPVVGFKEEIENFFKEIETPIQPEVKG